MDYTNLPALKTTWFIPPAEQFLPNVAVAFLGDAASETLSATLNEWRSRWIDLMEIGARNEDAKLDDMGQNGLAHLFLMLGDQSDRTMKDAALLVDAAAELRFPQIILSILTETSLRPNMVELASRCDIVLHSTRNVDLLLPLRLLLSPDRLVGYDNSDVFAIWKGRIGEVSHARTIEELATSASDAKAVVAMVNSPSPAAAMTIADRLCSWAKLDDVLVAATVEAVQHPHLEIISLK